MVEDLLAEAAQSGDVRGDIVSGELANHCLHALTAAGALPSEAAVHRLVTRTFTGVRPGGADASDSPRRADASVHATHHRERHAGRSARP
jgi:hypothetical protein